MKIVMWTLKHVITHALICLTLHMRCNLVRYKHKCLSITYIFSVVGHWSNSMRVIQKISIGIISRCYTWVYSIFYTTALEKLAQISKIWLLNKIISSFFIDKIRYNNIIPFRIFWSSCSLIYRSRPLKPFFQLFSGYGVYVYISVVICKRIQITLHQFFRNIRIISTAFSAVLSIPRQRNNRVISILWTVGGYKSRRIIYLCIMDYLHNIITLKQCRIIVPSLTVSNLSDFCTAICF